jgi:peptide/nickel transport system substrate-binding protein
MRRSQMVRLRIIAVVAVAISVLATACSPAASPSPSGAAPSGAAPSGAAPSGAAVGGGGNIVIVTPTEPEVIDAATISSFGHQLIVGKNIIQGLVGMDPVTGELVPELALSWTNPEPTKWVFELRQGVTFHDGSPFNAAAAVTSMEHWYKNDIPGIGGSVGSPATFKALDEYTLELTSEEPDLLVPPHMTYMPVSSAKQLTEDPDSLPELPIGTGPYKFVSWEKGSKINLELYPDSWLAAPGMFDTVEWQYRTENSVRAAMIQTGEADITFNLTASECGSVTCASVPSPETWNMRIDSYKSSFLGDVRVRKAIAMGVNFDEFVPELLGSTVDDNLGAPGTPAYNPDIVSEVGYAYDVEAAKALLAEAATDGVDITQPIELKYVTDYYVEYVSIAPVVEQDLKALGLNVSIKPEPIDTALKEIIWDGGTSLLNDMPAERNHIWLREGGVFFDYTDTKNDLLCTGLQSVYCNPEKDKEYQAAALLSGDARNEAFKDVWRSYYDEVAMLPYTAHPILWAFSSRIEAPPIREFDGLIPLWLMTN